jgi:uncharacterized protein (TIGR02246 family)
MGDRSADRAAILDLAATMEEAWRRGDAAGFAAPFTDDASFVAWNGAHGYGRQAIEDAHRPLFAGPLAGSRMDLVGHDAGHRLPESLRFVRPDVAIMVTVGAVTLAGQHAADHRAVQTFVLTSDHRRWQVAAFHNTRQHLDP